jgi:hypothetical protein
MSNNTKKPSDYNEKELLEKIASFSKRTAENTGTIKNIAIVYFVCSIIVGVLVVLGLF